MTNRSRKSSTLLFLAAAMTPLALVVGYGVMFRPDAIVMQAGWTQRDAAMPPYQHIFVIIGENKSFDQINSHPDWAPNLGYFAAEYGSAIRFYSEVHPSEGNYVAMLSGDTFGIHDDDAFFCHPSSTIAACPNADEPGYSDHVVAAPALMDQLSAKGLSWKAYLEDFQPATPLLPSWPAPDNPVTGRAANLYASKHNGFLNFRSINTMPSQELLKHFGNFQQLGADLASGNMPTYAHVVPNECNNMHGLAGPNVPPDCSASDLAALVRRGDAAIGMLVNKIMRSRTWASRDNVAIVITFDESDGSETAFEPHGCCGSDPTSIANFGGGHIPTIVVTNHGPRHLSDATPYNHYSLLRSTEAAFGIRSFLGAAANRSDGVVAMTPLFATRR